MSSRNLTTGEIALAKKIFKGSIAYERVRIHDEAYVFFQPNNSGMTPNGEIYVTGGCPADYSTAESHFRAFFIHEMTHVWQFQLDVLNKWRAQSRLFTGGSSAPVLT